MGHEMIQRMWRNKSNWLRTLVQENPVTKEGSIYAVMKLTAERQERELRGMKAAIKKYEDDGSKAEKLFDTI